jgi:hypothetical protein
MYCTINRGNRGATNPRVHAKNEKVQINNSKLAFTCISLSLLFTPKYINYDSGTRPKAFGSFSRTSFAQSQHWRNAQIVRQRVSIDLKRKPAKSMRIRRHVLRTSSSIKRAPIL